MGLIFLRNRVSGVAPFDPASLFASGEEGVWYEPSTTTCFTDALGTVAATYGDEVQYLEDLSGNGNHATQGTFNSRPTLARVPERGRVNELSETATLATQSVTVTAAERTLSFKGTGTVTLSGASTAGPLVGTGAGDRVTLTFTPSAGSLTLTVSGTVTDGQLELGDTATAYQLVADADGYDITESGVDSLDYLSFDGTDDFMSIPLAATSGATELDVFQAYESPDVTDSVFTPSYLTSSTDFFYASGFLSGDNFFRVAMGVQGTAITDSASNDTPYVVSALLDTSSPSLVARVNGSGVGSDTNIGTNPVSSTRNFYYGARNNAGTADTFGTLKSYGLIVRGASSTSQEISDTETYLANRSGVSLA